MNENEILREQLLYLLRGGGAHLGFDEAVNRFPIEYINSKAGIIPYTPWQLLEHMRLAQWDIVEFIRNPDHVSPDWPEGYWPAKNEQADDRKWEKTVKEFNADLRAVQKLVEDPSVNLFAPLPHAEKYNLLREVLLVADHNAYHVGSLILLHQALGIKKL